MGFIENKKKGNKMDSKTENTIIATGLDDFFIVPRKIMNCIKGMSATELKLFLFLCENKSCTQDEATSILGLTAEEYEAAAGYLRGTKIFELSKSEDAPKKKMSNASLIQSYDGELIAEALETNKDFKFISEVAASCLGKANLNRNDLNSLYNLYDYVGLDANFICGVIHYCASREKTSMQYIMKTALSLTDSGITSYEQLEEYLKKKEESRTEISKFKSLCGFGNRALSAKEEKFVTRWFEELCYSFEIVKVAYEITVDKTHEVNFNYMGKILENWYAAGYRTLDDIKGGATKKAVPKTDDSFNVDDFVAAALKKSGY